MVRRVARNVVAGAALAGAALTLGGMVAGSAASQPLPRRSLEPFPSVLSPRGGQQLPARPALVKLYLGYAQVLEARLNGRRIRGDLLFGTASRAVPCASLPVSETRGGTCQLLASPSDGLRYGANLLTVRFKFGHSVRVRTVRFRVAGDQPLAAAGGDRRVRPGTRIQLNGRASLIPPGLRTTLARSGERASLRYLWRVVNAPRATRTRVTGATTATPSIALRSRGTYTVRLTVTASDGRTGTDFVTLSAGSPLLGGTGSSTAAADAAPMVRVETMVNISGHWGVELGASSFIDHPPEGCTHRNTTGFYCFYPDPGEGRKWLQLLVLNRADLSLIDNHVVDCTDATSEDQEHSFDFSAGGDIYYNNHNRCLQDLVNYINGLNDNDLVIAVNQPGDGTNKSEQPPVGAGAALSGKFIQPFANHNLGISATGWFDAPGNGENLLRAVRGTFSAIGVPGWTTGGISSMPEDPHSWDPQGSGRLVTNIAVDNHPRYSPFARASRDAEAQSPLLRVLFQPNQDWPAMSPGQAAAFAAIGASDKVGLTADPRAEYYSGADVNWAAKQTAIANLQYSEFTSPAFSEDDFKWAKNELYTEVFWITEVDSYIGALAEPYSDLQGTLWGNVAAASNDVKYSETANGTAAQLVASAKAVMEIIVEVVPLAGSLYHWSEKAQFEADAFAAAYYSALAVAETDSGERADGDVSAVAGDLGSELSRRLDAAKTEIRDRFRNIIVADYGKLRTVALCSTSSPGCDDPQNGWSVTRNGVTNMRTVLELGLQRELYTKLLPEKYPLALGLTPVTQGDAAKATNDAANWCRPVPPFVHTTGVYPWPQVDHRYFSLYAWRDTTVTPIVLTTGDPGTWQKWSAANWTVFGRMFNGVDPGGSFENGGLGINEQQFMVDNYGLALGYDRQHRPGHFEHFRYGWEDSTLKLCDDWKFG